MMRKLVFALFLLGVTYSLNAQTLFTYGSNSVSKDEFFRVYKKNSTPKSATGTEKKQSKKGSKSGDVASGSYDMSDTALRSYLDLYSLFKMKVAEAENEKLDTLLKVQSELDNYRKQLAKNYLTDSVLINKMIHEAYDRMKEDIHIEHILVSCPPGADSVKAFKKIDSIYNQVVENKVKFEDIARLSDDKETKDKGGDLGYITSLQYVYQIEDAAYGTPVGKVSKPFRSQFGYHIVKVLDKHADRGTVQVAQIMLATPKSKGADYEEVIRKRADSIVAKLRAGADYNEMVKKFSDDKHSVADNGVLKPFGTGKMVYAFENAAFSLKKAGDISDPVKTEYGYHIIKLISKKPLLPFDSLFSYIKHKVENDARAQNAKEAFYEKVKAKYGYKENAANLAEIEDAMANSVADTGRMRNAFRASTFKNMTKTVFTLDNHSYTQYDYACAFEKFTHGKINGPKKVAIHDAFKMYVADVVNDFEEHHLVESNPDFKALMTEYKDGIMLFELMDRNVWSKASHDSIGLRKYFEDHKSKYMWEAGFEGSVYNFKNKQAYDTGMYLINTGLYTDEQVTKMVNDQKHPDRLSVQHGHFEFSKFRDATQAELTANKTKTIKGANDSYKVIIAKSVNAAPINKTLEEARGYVVAEYQDYLEKQWNEKMRAEFPMKVDEKVFKSMVKK